jgi:putative ABC transport system permease protein
MINKNDCMKNSIKQLFRKKWMSILFFCIIMLGTVFFTLGCSLWMGVQDSINRMKDTFTTIGTVTQKPDNIVTEKRWDAALKKYKIKESSNYTQILDVDILNNLDIVYMHKLEKRSFYGAVSPDFITGYGASGGTNGNALVMEFSPLKDCVPNGPVEVEVKKIYWGDSEPSLVGQTVLFCDHYKKNPQPLESGKRYIVFSMMNFMDQHSEEGGDIEYVPESILLGKDQVLDWGEMEKDFWNTDKGTIWKNFIYEINRLSCKTAPVTPTGSTELLNPFHNGRAMVTEGEDICAEEYRDGSKVCLISQTFAELNNLQVEQKIKLQMYFTDDKYSTTAGRISSGGMFRIDTLSPEGENYDIFYEADYMIKGIYSRQSTGGENLDDFAPDEIIIPSASVPEEKVRNVIAEGPMQGYNASFQIENGGINDFYKEFSKLPESSLLEVTFDDKGYERFASQMNNMQTIAVIIFLVGFVSVIASSAFLLYSAIIRQRRRTAIERALGMTRRECRVSLLTGIMLLTIAAACVGGTIGGIANEKMLNTASLEEDYFSSMYSKGVIVNKDEELSVAVNQNIVRNSIVFAVSVEVLGTFAMSLFLIGRNLKVNPIQLLGVREEE